jgi:hypothetical protein
MVITRYVLILFFFGFIISLTSTVFAWTQDTVTYYNNWNNSAVFSDTELNVSNPYRFPYNYTQNETHYLFQKNNDSLILSKSLVDEVITEPTKISINVSTTKGTIANKSVANGTGLRYIHIPDSLLKLRFIFDDVLPVVLIDNGTEQWYADSETYWYSKIDGEIRFNFETAPYTDLNDTDIIVFIFHSWNVDNAIVSGLTDVGLNSAPNVFTNNSTFYLITGMMAGTFSGYNWTGSTWQSDSAIVSGLSDIGDASSPNVFINNSKLYLISGEYDGVFNGFNWSGSAWQSDSSIVSGLSDVGYYSAPFVFNKDGKLYLISGEYDGVFNGYNWTGSTWQSDSAIVSGLSDIGLNSAPSIYLNNSILYLITGTYMGVFNGFNWSGSAWQSDSSIVSGLSDIGENAMPTIYTNNNTIYLISGKLDGTFSGFNTSYYSGQTYGNRSLYAINASVNLGENCAVDYIVYRNLSTGIEYTYTCGQSGNASVIVHEGEAVFMNATQNISKVRTW